MSGTTDKHCAICGAPLGAALLTITEPDRFEKRCGVAAEGYRRQWIACEHCGTATNDLPAQSVEKLATLRSAYYEVDFAGSDIGEKYRKVMALPPGQSDNAGRVARILEFLAERVPLPDAPKVLDIGAGTGVFLSRFLSSAAEKWQGVGVEPDPHASAHLRSLGQFEVVEALYQGQPELKGFTLVTLNKVLEHIGDPVPLLRQVASALGAGNAVAYVELPDLLTIDCRAPSDNILGALHCHLYDPRSLGYLFHAAGLETLKIERIFEPSGKITVFGFACLPGMLEISGKTT